MENEPTQPIPPVNQPTPPTPPPTVEPVTTQSPVTPIQSETLTQEPQDEKPKPKSIKWAFVKFVFGLIFIGLIYGFIVFWPLKHLLTKPSILSQPNLTIFFNESETRPCGGFVTAFGKFRAFPPQYQLTNAYHFQGTDFGDAPAPLDKISAQLNFWDLGSHFNPQTCTEVFRTAYQSSKDQKVGDIWLVNFSTIEKLFALVAPLEIDGVTYTKDNFFASLSRSVSDIDRHNEKVLQERKQPLSQVAKAMIKHILLNPIKTFQASSIVAESLESGEIYNQDFSPEPILNTNQFRIVEWNLGGGKSSRFLKKHLKVRLKQAKNQTWSGTIIFEAEHLGALDQPISQDYKGVMDIQMPEDLGGEVDQINMILKPGEFYRKEYLIQNQILQGNLSLFVPRGQKVSLDLGLTAFPQQIISTEDAGVEAHEHVLKFEGPITYPGKNIAWKTIEDLAPPFPTLHTVTSKQSLPRVIRNKMGPSNFIVEVHLNETVKLDNNFKAELIDTNYENTETNHPQMKQSHLMADQKTLLIGFESTRQQLNERFTLSLYGIRDMWGNRLEGRDKWTVIPR